MQLLSAIRCINILNLLPILQNSKIKISDPCFLVEKQPKRKVQLEYNLTD